MDSSRRGGSEVSLKSSEVPTLKFAIPGTPVYQSDICSWHLLGAMKDMVYDTADPVVRLQMDDEVRVIEALPAVRGLQYLPASRSKDAGYQATLMCYAGREHGGCGKTMEPLVFLTNSRTTLLGCLQELRKRLEMRHGGACVAGCRSSSSCGGGCRHARTSGRPLV